VERTYDIFEKFPNGDLLWRGVVQGHENAIARLRELGQTSSNEHFVLHTPTQAVIARINSPESK
jgi:hypothetical protein